MQCRLKDIERNIQKMQPKTKVGVLYYCTVLLVLLFGSVCANPVRNSGKQQFAHERMKRGSDDSEGGDGNRRRPLRDAVDLWPAAAAVPVCAEDEYYDVNVQACSRCSDVCRPNTELTFCASKCREYFRNHFVLLSVHTEVRHSSSAVTVISSPDGAREERLTEKPLFWTSIVSMTIAVAATAAIIVLCLRRKKPRRSLVDRMQSNEDSRARTLSETSDDREPEHRTLLNNTSGDSARNTSCREARRDFDESNNQSMYITGGTGGGGGGGGLMTDRLGSGICNQNDHSHLPEMPSPDLDRHPSPQKVSQIYYLHSNPIHDNNSTNVYQNPAKVDIWTMQNGKEPSPCSFSMSEFAENKRQLQTDSEPLVTSLSTSPTTYSQETPYTSLMNEVSQARGKGVSYLREEDETFVKENRFIDLQGPPRLPIQGDFSLEPKAMGILMNNGNLLDDFRKLGLQVSVRMTTESDTNPAGHCAKAKTTLYSSPPACDDGIATGIDEPN